MTDDANRLTVLHASPLNILMLNTLLISFDHSNTLLREGTNVYTEQTYAYTELRPHRRNKWKMQWNQKMLD